MWFRIRPFVLFLLVIALGSAAARAQFAIYGLGSGANLSASSGYGGFTAWGGLFGVYDDFLRLGPVKVGGDVRYFQHTSSNDGPNGNKLRGVLLGPRVALKVPLVPVKPYVQAEIGDVATNYGTLQNMPNSFGYQIQGGIDFTVFPHVDLRGEYGGGQINGYGNGQRQALQVYGAGVVVRFF